MATEITEKAGHEKISYTADLVAYARMFSDIPYSREIAKICGVDALTGHNAEIHRNLAPYFEGRFKALSHLLVQSGSKNVLELASGLSPRGLIMATENPSLTFIETDLADKLKQKQELLKELCAQQNRPMPPNLRFIELNVLDEEKFYAVISEFPAGQVAIGNEGLLAYFNHDEKWATGRTIRKILSLRGGIWATPDIFTLADMDKTVTPGKHQEALDEIKERTRRDYRANAFADLDAAKKTYHDLGFEFDIFTLAETAGDIVSTRIGLDVESVQKQLSLNIWEFRSRSWIP